MEDTTHLEYWQFNGSSPISDFLMHVEVNDLKQIKKKDELFSKKTVRELCLSRDLTKIKGTGNPPLYELRYQFKNPYRAICLRIKENELLIVEIFRGSGSGGEVEKHLPIAIKRAKTIIP